MHLVTNNREILVATSRQPLLLYQSSFVFSVITPIRVIANTVRSTVRPISRFHGLCKTGLFIAKSGRRVDAKERERGRACARVHAACSLLPRSPLYPRRTELAPRIPFVLYRIPVAAYVSP